MGNIPPLSCNAPNVADHNDSASDVASDKTKLTGYSQSNRGLSFAGLGHMQTISEATTSEADTLTIRESATSEDSDESPRSKTCPRMLLTSGGLTAPSMLKKLESLLQSRRPSGNYKMLYVSDATMAEEQQAKEMMRRIEEQVKPLGVTFVQHVSLRNCPHKSLADQLAGVDCVYLELGNTFYLRYQMQASGFDELIKPLVLEKGVVLVGASAGSICMGRSVTTALWKGWDDPGYGKDWDLSVSYGYDGLDLLPEHDSVFPHYGQQWANLVEKKCAEMDHDVIILDEEHAFYCNGRDYGFIK